MRQEQPAVKILPDAYPTISGTAAAHLSRALRDPRVVALATRRIESHAGELRPVVLGYIACMEEAAGRHDLQTVFEQAHEVRCMAGIAGLAASGRIANVLCGYLDAVGRAGRKPETSLIALHLEAIGRAAHAKDEATRLGDAVARELAHLVEKKLTKIHNSSRKRSPN